jgi:hypothetical protein
LDLRGRKLIGGWKKLRVEEPHKCFAKYYNDDEMKEDKMGETYSTHAEIKIANKVKGKPKRQRPLRRPCVVSTRINLLIP